MEEGDTRRSVAGRNKKLRRDVRNREGTEGMRPRREEYVSQLARL